MTIHTKSTTAPPELKVKSLPFEVKAVGTDDDLQEGEFIGYASAFGNLDSDGDITDAGAFDRTLAEWAEKGDTLPILWGHDLYDPFSFIGGALEATPDEKGLKIHGQLDIADNPKAAQVYRLLKGRRVRKMSFAYGIQEAAKEDDGYHLKDLDLYEVSVVPIPANQEAEIVTVKSALAPILAGVKAGRVLSAKNESALRDARDAIDSVLEALATQDPEDGDPAKAGSSSTPASPASGDPSETKAAGQTEEPSGAKVPPAAEESKSGPSVETWDNLFTAYAGL